MGILTCYNTSLDLFVSFHQSFQGNFYSHTWPGWGHPCQIDTSELLDFTKFSTWIACDKDLIEIVTHHFLFNHQGVMRVWMGGGGGGVWYSLFIKNLAHYSSH